MSKEYLSPSRVSMYLRCPKQFEFRYVKGLVAPPRIVMTQSKAWHSAVEANYTQKVESKEDLPLDEMTDRFAEEFDEAVKSEEPICDEMPADKAKDQGVEITKAHHTVIAPEVKPREIERPFTVSLGKSFPYDLHGVVDLVEEDGTIVDNKAKGRTPSQQDVDRDIQLTAYALASRIESQEVEPRLAFDVVVKTKTPKALRLVTTRTNRDMRAYLQTVERVATGIKAGVFPGNPTSFLCNAKFCGYWDRCSWGGGNE